MEHYPSGFLEKTGNLWRAQARRMRLDFKHFQQYFPLADEDPESWHGEIRDGDVVMSHDEALEEEEAAQAQGSKADGEYEAAEDGDAEDEEEAVEEGEWEDEPTDEGREK
ncbi:hypothetical protein AB0D12_35670 [Streptomyces sp. NPDC048479]|uniref:hypothetical protein n=1 Tax=Streptomyces sp. NPDC048479 TaxID=3154725 RepID=UPI0034490DC4